MEEFRCKRCNKVFKDYNGLMRHTRRIHNIKSENFYVEFYLNSIRPTCKCGCGEYTTFNGHGFVNYKRGHASRIKNNWGHNSKAIKHSAETRRQQYKDGSRHVWNKGLDITDERVRKNAENTKQAILADKNLLKKKSELAKKQWKDGNLKIRYGDKSAAWCGGNSSTNATCHANKRLYNEWKFPILKKYNFKCSACGKDGRLDVHHNEVTMSEIIKIIIGLNKLDKREDKRIISELVTLYHIKNNISGIALCRNCHKKEHNNLNL